MVFKTVSWKKWISVLLILFILVLVAKLIQFGFQAIVNPHKAYIASTALVPSIVPTDTEFVAYKRPVLAKKKRYDVFLVGDSMTHAFGPRGGIFTELLSKEYPGIFFEVSNYAEGGLSVIMLPDRMKVPIQADKDLLLKPILAADHAPDLIIIESFGYNPLSQLGKDEGLKKQSEVLTEVMKILTRKYPNAVIMFLATIAPDKNTYGAKINSATVEERWVQSEERIEYITNHIKFAKEFNIPLINAYEASIDETGDGDVKYINPDDTIHPSQEGLALIAREMVKKIGEENIFPK